MGHTAADKTGIILALRAIQAADNSPPRIMNALLDYLETVEKRIKKSGHDDMADYFRYTVHEPIHQYLREVGEKRRPAEVRATPIHRALRDVIEHVGGETVDTIILIAATTHGLGETVPASQRKEYIERTYAPLERMLRKIAARREKYGSMEH